MSGIVRQLGAVGGLVLVLALSGCAVEVTGAASPTPPVTQAEREDAFVTRIAGNARSGGRERALALGWNACGNMPGTSIEWNIEALAYGGRNLVNREQATTLVFAALAFLCPHGERHR